MTDYNIEISRVTSLSFLFIVCSYFVEGGGVCEVLHLVEIHHVALLKSGQTLLILLTCAPLALALRQMPLGFCPAREKVGARADRSALPSPAQ